MVKTAIFVEGQTELIFVRELLLRYFEYQNIRLECFHLAAEGNMKSAPHDFFVPDARFYFQIISVGNDKAVLSNLLKREKSIWKSGFNRAIGLRDMYSEEYRNMADIREVLPTISEQFIAGYTEQIKTAAQPENIFFRFAIMETEAWLLALPQVFESIDVRLSTKLIKENLGFDLDDIDPEAVFFHPANFVEQIFELIGRTYRKKEGDIEALVSSLGKSDYQQLLCSGKCGSFKHFFETIPLSY